MNWIEGIPWFQVLSRLPEAVWLLCSCAAFAFASAHSSTNYGGETYALPVGWA